MQTSPSMSRPETYGGSLDECDVGPAVSWAAIFAGTFVIVALTFLLLTLGAGIGLATISPWPREGVSGEGLTIMAAVWLILVPLIANGIGGYISGRLRAKWVGVHTHEIYFRDTANGFITWAVALMFMMAMIVGSASVAFLGTARMMGAAGQMMDTMQRNGTLAPGMMGAGEGPMGAYLDSLLRPDPSVTTPIDPETRREVGRIVARAMADGTFSDADRTYLSQTIAARTGMAPADVDRRIQDVMNQMRQAADQARKAAMGASLYTVLSMLVGAFMASFMAALGGKHRDDREYYARR